MTGMTNSGHAFKSSTFAQVFHKVMDSHAWAALSTSERSLYLEMRRKLNGKNNGNISATLNSIGNITESPASLAKWLRALCAVGLISKTKSGGVANGGSSSCNLYRFTDLAVLERELPAGCKVHSLYATNEWEEWESKDAAAAAIAGAHKAVKRPPPKQIEGSVSELGGSQQLNPPRSGIDLVGRVAASLSELVGAAVASESDLLYRYPPYIAPL